MAKRSFNVDPFDQESDEDRYITACAKLRNITPHSLVKRLLKTIARDQMVVAILDDSNHLLDREPGEHGFRGKAHKLYGAKEYPL